MSQTRLGHGSDKTRTQCCANPVRIRSYHLAFNPESDMDKIKPRPPEPLPVTPVEAPAHLDPTPTKDYIMQEKFAEWKGKTIFRSRTIITVTVSVVGFILTKFFGLDVDLGMFIEAADGLQVGELILTLGAVIAGFFRKHARADLSNSNG